MQGTGNLVIYAPDYPGGQKAIWASTTVQKKPPPFSLGAIGPFLAMPIIGGTNQGLYVTTIHGTTLGNPKPPSKSKTVLAILGDVLDAIALVLTFVGGPLGDVASVLGDAVTAASLSSGAASVAVSAAAGAKSNAVGSQASSSTNSGSTAATTTTLDLGSTMTPTTTKCPGQPRNSPSIKQYGGCVLLADQYLESPNGNYKLVMQATGDLQLLAGAKLLWDTGTTTLSGVHECGSGCAVFRVEATGTMNVTVSTGPDKAIWRPTPETIATPGPLLTLQNDGNLVLYANGGSGPVRWSSGTALAASPTSPDNLGPTLTPTGCANATAWGGCLLQSGQYLASADLQYALVMQSDGNLVLYDRDTAIWSTGTSGNPGAFLRVQTDGTLLVMNAANSNILWQPSPSTAGTGNATLTMQDDGNLVLYGTNGKGGISAVWQSGTASQYGTAQGYTALTACGKTSPNELSAGEVLAVGGCLVSPNDQYELIMQTDGNLVLYYQDQSDPLWASYPTGPPAGAGGGEAVLFGGEFQGSFCVGRVSGAWCNDTTAPNAYLVLDNSGNLAEYANNGTVSAANVPYVAWQTGTGDLRGQTLPSGDTLTPGQYLQSPNGMYKLTMGTTGLLELSYVDQSSYFCPMWSRPLATASLTQVEGLVTGTSGETYTPPLVAGSYLIMQGDGNLVLVPPATKEKINISATQGNTGAYAQLGNDGNLTVYGKSGNVLWQSGTNLDRGSALCTGAAMSDGQYLTKVGAPNQRTSETLVMQGDCNLVYYYEPGESTWSSGTDEGDSGAGAGETPGNPYYGCFVTMQGTGNLVIYAPNYPGGQKVLWASNTVQKNGPPNLVKNLGPYTLAVAGYPGDDFNIVSDSGKTIYTVPVPSGLFATNGSTAVSAVQLLVGILSFLLL
jgi:hypothetical protein